MLTETLKADALDRFLRYVRIDTRSDPHATTVPSTPGQLTLLRLLVDELTALKLHHISLDEHGYVMATVPGNAPAPTIGFLAHVDTSPEMSGTNVRPLVHTNYDGRDLILPDDPSAVLRLAEQPELGQQFGHDIITASGKTLLGADDKAGIAAIMAAAAYLMTHPEIPHGPVRLGFTPDEEIGRGSDFFDVLRFGAVCAYTLDGGERGDLEIESFSADTFVVTFTGFNTHPGYAKGRMINAIKMAAEFINRLPVDALSPETTEDREGYLHPHMLAAAVEQTEVRVLLRDFTRAGLDAQAAHVEQLAAAATARFPGGRYTVAREESYRNMREVLDRHPEVVDRAAEAIRQAGLTVRMPPIRGGTDGSRLSFMGLPTPNLFAGEHNIHSRLEWVSAEDMAKAAEVVIHLSQIWTRLG
ncbi:MAG TPA: peptidase T [Vicinamibacterales bacterium]|jgi:tripeptide aminopeptidase